MAGVGVVLLSTAYMLITLAVVALAAVFIGDTQYRWFFAFLAVGVLWALLGGVSVYVAKREFARNRIVPQKTIEVLKADRMWLQKEAGNQI